MVSYVDERLKLHPRATKTWEEYTTMAMLLGYRYVRTIHAFAVSPITKSDQRYLDADTLLPDGVNTWHERQQRRNEWAVDNRSAVIGP